MSEKPQISDERKLAYYGGAVLMGIGFLLFISTFFSAAKAMNMPFHHDPAPGIVGRGVGGMVLIIVGAAISNIGARGLAGSGVVLDPERARDDLKPWAKMAGGIVKDAIDEVREPRAATAPAVEVVKVRCPKCRALNDEDAKFCKACGTEL
jgi:hypothetical protein